MRAVVCHVGSRRGYAVPAAFAEAGMLERFYTDMCATNGLGRLAGPLLRVAPVGRSSLKSLVFRAPPPKVAARTTTLDLFGLRVRRRMYNASPAEHIQFWNEAFETFGRTMIARGFGDGNFLYSLMHEAGPALAEARRRGMKTGADVYIAPSWDRMLVEEHRRFPNWGETPITFCDVLGKGFRPYEHMIDNADLFICPSPFVRRDLIETFGVDQERTALVPYAVAPLWLELKTHPERGRVLFPGTAAMRKGIHYFALAAVQLRAQGDNYEFVVAGEVTPAIREKGEAMGLTFLGRVPRSDMAAEFARADVVVLPSIAEGSAGATYEALAAGIPQVVSAAAGSVARDGLEGVVMAVPDAHNIAEAVSRIVADRALRERMSISARERAQDFTWKRFSERLLTTILGLDSI